VVRSQSPIFGEARGHSPGRSPGYRWLVLSILTAANLGLLVVVSSGVPGAADVAAPVTGHLIGFGLAASLALIVRGWMPAVLAAGIAATIGVHAWPGLSRCCTAPPAQAGPTPAPSGATGQRLTVLAFNTWDAVREYRSLARYLATAPADIVILSEFEEAKRPLLAEVKSSYPHQVSCAAGRDCALALLSRLPLAESGVGTLDPHGLDFVWGRLGTSLTVVGTHVQRPSSDPHLHIRQMADLTDFVRRMDGSVVLAGDFNNSLWSSTFRRLRDATGLVPTSFFTSTWPAWPLPLPQVALDHILVSADLAVLATGTGPALGSDHLPVWAQLRLAPTLDRVPRQPSRVISRLAAAGPHLGGQLLADFGGEHVGARDLRR
jgi:endonuclease/exonuclease/phosphatase (EEP) superfamily protein YafD